MPCAVPTTDLFNVCFAFAGNFNDHTSVGKKQLKVLRDVVRMPEDALIVGHKLTTPDS
jgi:hypothetical protein